MKKLLFIVATAALIAGCGKSVDVDGAGMYMNANSGVIGIGNLEVVTNPEGSEAARIHYEEDVAWMSPSTKVHDFKAQLYGTNACEMANQMVENICNAFASSTNATLFFKSARRVR